MIDGSMTTRNILGNIFKRHFRNLHFVQIGDLIVVPYHGGKTPLIPVLGRNFVDYAFDVLHKVHKVWPGGHSKNIVEQIIDQANLSVGQIHFQGLHFLVVLFELRRL